MKQIILDTETTGLEPSQGHRICEIALLQLVGQGECIVLHQLLNPERELDERAAQVNGHSWQALEDKPKFPEIHDQLISLILGAELIIHNAPFDLGFIDAELKRRHPESGSLRALAGKITCTRELARRVLPGKKHSLDLLCDHYGIDRSHRQQHDAVTDCRLLARVYRQLMADAA